MIKTTVRIEGMMCHHCENRMNKAIVKNFAVSDVTSSARDNVTVVISSEPLDEAILAKAVTELGFTFLGAAAEAC